MTQPQKEPQGERDDLELVAEQFYRQYDILFQLSAQMLAATNLDDRLSLVLDAVTTELGYSHAALALLDHYTRALQMRMAVGFPDHSGVSQMILPGKFASSVEPTTAGSH